MVAGEDRGYATAAEPIAVRAAGPASYRETAAPVIAIDGPSGAGKSTVARELARRHHWRLVDTGAMYRALTWTVLEQAVPADDPDAITRLAESLPLHLATDPDEQTVRVGDTDVTAAIRGPRVTAAVSAVSAVPGVRRVMLARQRALAAGGGVVVEGRDIGTTVLPDADLKIFLTASDAQRTARRSGQTGEPSSDVASALARRDHLDSSRSVSPLQQAADALLLDSSELSVEQVVARIEQALAEHQGDGGNPPAPVEGAAPSGARATGRPSAPAPADGPVELLRGPGPRKRRARRWGPVLLVLRWLAQRVVRVMLRVRIVNEGRIPPGPALLAGNHTGFLDGPLVFILLPRPSCFLAKAELFDGFWAPLLRWVQQIPVHRGEPDRDALQAALTALRDGELVGMFPEGTRGEGKLETIQDGVGYLAATSGCPVVPIVCRGTAHALPRGRLIPRLRTRVDIVIGEPFLVTARPPLRRSDIRRAAEEIADQLRRLVADEGIG